MSGAATPVRVPDRSELNYGGMDRNQERGLTGRDVHMDRKLMGGWCLAKEQGWRSSSIMQIGFASWDHARMYVASHRVESLSA